MSFLTNPITVWSLAILTIISGWSIFFSLRHHKKKIKNSEYQTNITYFLDFVFEKIYSFFEEALGEDSPIWIKSYVINLFLVILVANILGLIIDIWLSAFPNLSSHISSPTSDLHFTLALAICSVFIILLVEFKTKGWSRFFLSYLNPLNIIWIIARTISLSFRLYGNMLAGSLLLIILVQMLNQFSASILNWVHFPLLIPLIFYTSSALTAIIQAFVFSLLTSVFIRISLNSK